MSDSELTSVVTAEHNGTDPAAKVSDEQIGGRKRTANMENAKKSTGPRTIQGKAKSRFNAVKHGLLAKHIMFGADGQLIDAGLYELLESLRDKYGRGDVRTELLVESIVADYWRSRQGLQLEIKYLRPESWGFGPSGGMPNLQRYTTANRNSMLKSLERLDKLPAEPYLETEIGANAGTLRQSTDQDHKAEEYDGDATKPPA